MLPDKKKRQMIPWETIDQAGIPGRNGYLVLRKRGTEYSIRTPETELMNSRVHGSEDELARKACERLNHKPGLTILIGGLGMGYTLAAALEETGPDCRITVAELIPAVITWNKKYLGHLAGKPLNDPRVLIRQEDVADTISAEKKSFDAILLDVDNGPEGLTQKANNRLYTTAGLKKAHQALGPGGILAVWSAKTDPAFTRRLKQCKFNTRTIGVRARKSGKGSRHTIWLAQKPF
jgi:spermidine synthase